MDLKQLSQMDVKDLQKIDFKKIQSALLARPDIMIALVLVVLGLFVSVGILNGRRKESGLLKEQIAKLEKKISLADQYTNSQEEFKTLLAGLPKSVSEQELVNRVTDLAAVHKIKIASYTPGTRQELPLYDTSGIMLIFSTQSYDDVLGFVKDLEASGAAIRVDSWRGEISTLPGTAAGSQSDQILINVTMLITSVTFKNG